MDKVDQDRKKELETQILDFLRQKKKQGEIVASKKQIVT